jgi:hypothetical protein
VVAILFIRMNKVVAMGLGPPPPIKIARDSEFESQVGAIYGEFQEEVRQSRVEWEEVLELLSQLNSRLNSF